MNLILEYFPIYCCQKVLIIYFDCHVYDCLKYFTFILGLFKTWLKNFIFSYYYYHKSFTFQYLNTNLPWKTIGLQFFFVSNEFQEYLVSIYFLPINSYQYLFCLVINILLQYYLKWSRVNKFLNLKYLNVSLEVGANSLRCARIFI